MTQEHYAFPCKEYADTNTPGVMAEVHYPGMTLLDYFAAKAMQGYVTSNSEIPDEALATYSYDIAEAMLAEKKRREATK